MKKILMIACMIIASTAAFAQAGKTTIGIQGDYMLDDPNNFGIGANLGYEVINNVRGVAEFNYLLKKDHVSWWNVELNAEYLLKFGSLVAYPLVGIDLTGWKVSGGGYSEDDSKLGLNIGAGVEYWLSNSLGLKAEYNYKTQYDGWSMLKFGVVIPF